MRSICFVLLFLFVVLEATHHAANGKRLALVGSAVIGTLAAAVMLALACALAHVLIQPQRQKKQWYAAPAAILCMPSSQGYILDLHGCSLLRSWLVLHAAPLHHHLVCVTVRQT